MGNFVVYKHTSPSGKCYIGITCQVPEYRWGNNGYKYLEILKNGKLKHPYFANAILKYGWNNIKHEILHKELSKEEACKLEQEYITRYKSLGLSYNTTDGGEGVSGYKFSKDQREKMSKAHIGMKQSAETIAKRVAKNTGKVRTDEQKAKTSKPVCQLDLEGNFITAYFGANEASRCTGINCSHIVDCCNHKPKRRTAGGFMWEWQSV
jgi:group I intron endonuclease